MNYKNDQITPVNLKFLFDSFLIRKLNLDKQLTDTDRIISTKTLEIHAMEERYVQYLEKAKMILRQMDPRNNNSLTNQERQLLRKQIDEKDRKIKALDVRIFSSLIIKMNLYIYRKNTKK